MHEELVGLLPEEVSRRGFIGASLAAVHGFHADYRPSYNKEAATDGWRRLQDWFKKYGAA